jgi:hypothetical protein
MRVSAKMKPRPERSSALNSEKGQVLALAAVTMAGLLGIAALGVDLGYLYVARNELQNVADGSALAGARVLGHIYQGLPYTQQMDFVCDGTCEQIIDSTSNYLAHQNHAAGLEMDLILDEVIIGQWDGDNFTQTDTVPDAVKVIARRDDIHNGPVTTFFARILGVDASSVNAYAIAALTGQGNVWDGDITLPIAISKWFFENPSYCDEDIKFYPTNDPESCAGWTSWDYGSNDATLREILQENLESPEIWAGQDTINFTGGTLSNPTFDDLLSLFQKYGWAVQDSSSWDYLLDNGNRIKQPTLAQGGFPLWERDSQGNFVLDSDGEKIQLQYPDGTLRYLHKWETTVPVYDRDDCSNPNQSILIVGFAEVEMRDVYNAPDKLVKGIVKCDYVDEFSTRGGGGEYGVKGSVPGLVR